LLILIYLHKLLLLIVIQLFYSYFCLHFSLNQRLFLTFIHVLPQILVYYLLSYILVILLIINITWHQIIIDLTLWIQIELLIILSEVRIASSIVTHEQA